MIIIISHKHLHRLEKMMSQFLDDARAILERVAQGNAGDPAMKADIEALKTAVTANTDADTANAASDEEVKTLLTEILNKLAAAPPTP